MAFDNHYQVHVPFDQLNEFYDMLDWLDVTKVDHEWRGMTIFFKYKKDIPLFFLRWGIMGIKYGKDTNKV